MEPFTPAECDAIVSLVGDKVKPTRVLSNTCTAYRVPHRGLIVDALAAHGLPALDGQVVRYGPGGSYAWHTDGPGRDVTYIVGLSSPDSYVGGALEVCGPTSVVGSGQGAITSFDPRLRHRVTPVESGERWSLVAWAPITAKRVRGAP